MPLLVATFVAAVFALPAPVSAAAATLHVSPGGSDTAPGTAEQPFLTIGQAARAAGSGDTVLVAPGTYRETVTVPVRASNVTFRGSGPTRPILEGDGTRRHGFVANSATSVTITGFEVRGQTEAGIYVNGHGTTVTDNYVHHIGQLGLLHSQGIKVFYGARARVAGNVVHSIGPGGESFGIWMIQTRDAVIDGNSVYLVRKEGIRDWMGLDNKISDNRVFLNWAGLSLNTSTGSKVVNNYSYDNAVGIVAKHISYSTVLDHWKLSEPRWSRIWSNTIWRTSGTSLALGQSEEPFDYVDVRNNLFADAGLAYVHDMPGIRGPHVTVDANVYAPPSNGRPTYVYKSGWSKEGGIVNFDRYRSQLGWDGGGRLLDFSLIDPSNGNLDYSDSGPLAGVGAALPDGGGNQVGARGLAPAPATWTPYPMTPVDSSSKESWWTRERLGATSDGDSFSYWLSNTGHDEFVTYDFGERRTIDHLILSVFTHYAKSNIRGYRFEISDDGESWQTIGEGVNPDAAGSSYKYELSSPATGRYLRFTLVDTFCDSYQPRSGCASEFVFSDLSAGSMNHTVPPPLPGDAGSAAPPQAIVEVPRQSLRKVVRSRTLRADVSCDQACEISSALLGRRAKVLGRGSAALDPDRGERVKIRLKRAAVRKLAGRRSAKLKLRTLAGNESTGDSTAIDKVKLRR